MEVYGSLLLIPVVEELVLVFTVVQVTYLHSVLVSPIRLCLFSFWHQCRGKWKLQSTSLICLQASWHIWFITALFPRFQLHFNAHSHFVLFTRRPSICQRKSCHPTNYLFGLQLTVFSWPWASWWEPGAHTAFEGDTLFILIPLRKSSVALHLVCYGRLIVLWLQRDYF